MQTVITTIGTSLIGNQRRKRGEPLPDAAVTAAWLRDAGLERASAETHTWLKLGLLDEPERYRLLLVHTNTDDGRYCAERLQAWAEEQGLTCAREAIAGLGTAAEASFNLGLAELAWKLARCIRAGRERGEPVEIAATGGYKPETAVANLVGALLGAPVHYLYEGFAHPVTLKPLPIAFDLSGLRSGPGAALFQRFAAAAQQGGSDRPMLRRAEVESLLRSDPALELYLETAEVHGEELVSLNAIGEVVREQLEAPAAELPPVSDRTAEEKNQVSKKGHHRPDGWEAVVDRLRRNPYVTAVRHEDGRRGTRGRMEAAPGSSTEIAVLIADGKRSMGLRVSTTARTAAEREWVLQLLKQKVPL